MIEILLTTVMWLLVGAATARLARKRGRDPAAWFVWGVLFGIFTFILLWFLPAFSKKEEKPTLATPVTAIAPVARAAAPVTVAAAVQQWYLVDLKREQQGPLPFESLKDAWQRGELTPQALVWTCGMQQWQKIEQLPYLCEQLKS